MAESSEVAAIYCRVSTPRQAAGSGLGRQEDAGRQYAAERGFQLTEEHVYRDVCSGVTLQRPALVAVLIAMARREFTHLIVEDMDRLTRGPDGHWQWLEWRLKGDGVRLHFTMQHPELERGLRMAILQFLIDSAEPSPVMSRRDGCETGKTGQQKAAG